MIKESHLKRCIGAMDEVCDPRARRAAARAAPAG
jgi:hypothetical protein